MRNKIMYSKSKVQGSTIIEVMVSVFLLTFGILALLMAQIRSVVGVGEAENRTLIAQATESLAEGMQANPTLNIVNNQVKVTYDEYLVAAKPVPSGATFSQLTATGSQSRTQLATLQRTNFEAALNQIPDVATISYTICSDVDNPAEPTVAGGTMNGNCVAANAAPGAVIKVAWQMKQPNTNNANNIETYTYMLKVKG